MSSMARVRELNGGKLTRPRAQWKGRARMTRAARPGVVNPAQMPALKAFAAQASGIAANFGQLNFRRKVG